MKTRRFFVHIVSFLILVLCGSALAGCGRGAAEQRAEYYEAQSSWEALFHPENGGEEEIFLGMQYYGEEPVQLWTKGGNRVDIVRKDGSREVLLESGERAGIMEWALVEEGGIYCWKKDWVPENNEQINVIQYDASGEMLRCWSPEEGMVPEDICRLQDGSIAVLLKDKGEGSRRLGILDSGSDTVSLIKGIHLELTDDRWYIAAGEEGLLLLDPGMSEGITEIDLEDGSRLKTIVYPQMSEEMASAERKPEEMEFQKESEAMEIWDFRMGAEGSPEVLWADSVSGNAYREKLVLTKINREIIVLRAFAADGWLQERIVEFNISDGEYYVVLEECPEGTSVNDYAYRTSVQLTTGKGPDILYGDILKREYFAGMTQKGVFEDLAPLMEQSGIEEEDYFPFTFQYWREEEKIYTVCAAGDPYFYYVDGSILEEREEPDIEALVEALLAYPEEAYFEFMTRDQILSFFLSGSIDFWGMMDWEQGTCDFQNKLFAGMLKAAGRYSCREGEIVSIPERPFLAGMSHCNNLYTFESSEEMEEKGRIMAGLQFDDGCHAVIMSSQLAIVHEAPGKKEGAWKFLSYLLREDTQLTIRNSESGSWSEVPSNKGALDAIIRKDLAWMRERGEGKYVYNICRFPDGEELILKDKRYMADDITEERIAEYVELVEGARVFPAERNTLLDIICQEAEYYFDGVKSAEETADIINNRVELYMNENE